ncbi:hypothetical protein [Vibrio agarivorans]|uniref:Phage abortive infection protein n=1 Tax=Vibrio agarivorans TaxID=153622 RepID=A0ABT7XZB6_9VIBR|nr:hypothetical protein [Vibrio agarivorans]MDN2481116.1 hypothetical protein [Vibrio agarivorans]
MNINNIAKNFEKKSVEKKISQLWSFRVATLLIFGLVIWSTLEIHNARDYVLTTTSEGFSDILEVFKFPIALLASYLPTIGLIGLNHRSLQTKYQIRQTNNQDAFTNYYKHIEEYTKYINDTLNTGEKSYVDIRKSHYSLFPDAQEGVLEISQEHSYLAYRELMDVFSQSLAILNENTFNENQVAEYTSRVRNLEFKISKQIALNSDELKTVGIDDYYSNHELVGYCLNVLSGLYNLKYKLMKFDTRFSSIELSNIHFILEFYRDWHSKMALNNIEKLSDITDDKFADYRFLSSDLKKHIERAKTKIEEYLKH